MTDELKQAINKAINAGGYSMQNFAEITAKAIYHCCVSESEVNVVMERFIDRLRNEVAAYEEPLFTKDK